MIPNITRGSRMSGLMLYLASTDTDKTKNAHTDPHLVAGDAAIMAWYDDGVLDRDDAVAIAKHLSAEFGSSAGPSASLLLVAFVVFVLSRRGEANSTAGNSFWSCETRSDAPPKLRVHHRAGVLGLELLGQVGGGRYERRRRVHPDRPGRLGGRRRLAAAARRRHLFAGRQQCHGQKGPRGGEGAHGPVKARSQCLFSTRRIGSSSCRYLTKTWA